MILTMRLDPHGATMSHSRWLQVTHKYLRTIQDNCESLRMSPRYSVHGCEADIIFEAVKFSPLCNAVNKGPLSQCQPLLRALPQGIAFNCDFHHLQEVLTIKNVIWSTEGDVIGGSVVLLLCTVGGHKLMVCMILKNYQRWPLFWVSIRLHQKSNDTTRK